MDCTLHKHAYQFLGLQPLKLPIPINYPEAQRMPSSIYSGHSLLLISKLFFNGLISENRFNGYRGMYLSHLPPWDLSLQAISMDLWKQTAFCRNGKSFVPIFRLRIPKPFMQARALTFVPFFQTRHGSSFGQNHGILFLFQSRRDKGLPLGSFV